MSETQPGIERDPDTMSDDDFAAYKRDMAEADGDLPEDGETQSEKAEPEAQQDPEDLSDAELEEAAAKEKQESVPHGRFHRERERRKQLETEISDVRRRYELLEQRTTDILRMQGGNQQPQQREPTYQEQYDALQAKGDFIGIIELQNKHIRDNLQERETRQQESQRTQEERQLVTRIATAAKSDLEQAAADDEGFADMYKTYREIGYRQLVEVQGIPEDAAVAQLNRYEIQTYHDLMRQGIKPSDYVRRFVNAQGYRPPEPPQPNVEEQAARIERLNTAKLAAKTLSGAGSEARTTAPSPSDLVNMSDEDFAAFKKKYGENAMSKVFG